MPKGRRYTPEQIITKLREAEVLQSQGMSVEEAARIRDCVSDILSMAERIWGHEYNSSTQTERPGERESTTQEVGRRFVIGMVVAPGQNAGAGGRAQRGGVHNFHGNCTPIARESRSLPVSRLRCPIYWVYHARIPNILGRAGGVEPTWCYHRGILRLLCSCLSHKSMSILSLDSPTRGKKCLLCP